MLEQGLAVVEPGGFVNGVPTEFSIVPVPAKPPVYMYFPSEEDPLIKVKKTKEIFYFSEFYADRGLEPLAKAIADALAQGYTSVQLTEDRSLDATGQFEETLAEYDERRKLEKLRADNTERQERGQLQLLINKYGVPE